MCEFEPTNRSGFFTKRNFPFLRKIGLKTVVYLCIEDYPETNQRFLDSVNAKLEQFPSTGNKEPFSDIPPEVFKKALRVLLGL